MTTDQLKESSRSTFKAELAAAVVAALSAALLTSLVNLSNQHRVNPLTYLRLTLLATAAYLVAASLLHFFWPTSFRRVIPNWILISPLGSLIFVIVQLTPGVIRGGLDPLRLEPTWSEYLLNEMDAAKSVVLVLSAITLPVTGLAYYLIRRMAPKMRTR